MKITTLTRQIIALVILNIVLSVAYAVLPQTDHLLRSSIDALQLGAIILTLAYALSGFIRSF